MQTRRGLVEQKELAAPAPVAGRGTSWRPARRAQESCKLQSLRFAAGKRRDGLAELEVVETDFGERLERRIDVAVAGEESTCLSDGQVENLGNRLAFERDVEHVGAIARAIAVRAAQVDVGQELHLDMLESVAAARGTAARAGIEAERARRIAALFRERQAGEALADGVEGADVARRIGARGAADRRLVDHHHVFQERVAFQLVEIPRRLRGLAFRLQQRGVEDVLHERRLSRARHAGNAHELPERNADVDVLQVVLGGAEQLDFLRRSRGSGAPMSFQAAGFPLARE